MFFIVWSLWSIVLVLVWVISFFIVFWLCLVDWVVLLVWLMYIFVDFMCVIVVLVDCWSWLWKCVDVLRE